MSTLTLAVMVVWLPSAEAAPQGWSIQHTPSGPGMTDREFTGVSCASQSACTAVGLASSKPGTQVALAERWNGTRWSIQKTPSPNANPYSELNSVSCASRTACTGVGDYVNAAGFGVTLAEYWNGTRWSIQPTPSNPPGGTAGELDGVACESKTACIAVGSVEAADGNRVTLAERWNGSHWSIQRTPNPAKSKGSDLKAVSCVSPTACTAVGSFDHGRHGSLINPLAERWNGTRWSIQHTPSAGVPEGELSGVSCTSKSACTAVGDRPGSQVLSTITLVERWDGSRWSTQRSPNPGKDESFFDGVSCSSATACTAVGFANRPGGDLVPVVERWGGKHWLLQQTPEPAGATESELAGVSCGVKMMCTAAGWFRVHHDPFAALAEHHS